MTTTSYWGPFTQQPNILVLMTDQQRTAQHYPADWVTNNLPNLTQLQSTGVTFPNAMTNTTACSPSRSVLFTSTYPTLNGVIDVGWTLKLPQNITLPGQESLPLATLGGILQDSSLVPSGISYQVGYKGKWHLKSEYESGLSAEQQQNEAATLQNNDSDMETTYSFPGWTSPDFGTAMSFRSVPQCSSKLYTLGAGVGGNDARVTNGTSYPTASGNESGVQNAVDFLNQYTPDQDGTNPFFLVVSLLNPHDIWVYPLSVETAGFAKDGNGKYPWQYSPFTEISTPPSYTLTQGQLNNKPSAQGAPWQSGFLQDVATEYVQFYAYLETLTDALLGDVVTALMNNSNNLVDNTLIVRLADHGEMAMAQGGMREKEHQVYNETLLVPMIFSNPGLHQGRTCTGLAGLVDVIPTIATIAGIDVSTLEKTNPVQGTSLDQAILNAGSGSDTTYSELLFATDDANAHIRCLIEDQDYNAKYAVYYDATGVVGSRDSNSNPNGSASSFQYEMYNYSYDAGASPPSWDAEETNLIPVNGYSNPLSSPTIQTIWHNMHVALTSRLEAKCQKPDNWPDAPPLPRTQ